MYIGSGRLSAFVSTSVSTFATTDRRSWLLRMSSFINQAHMVLTVRRLSCQTCWLDWGWIHSLQSMLSTSFEETSFKDQYRVSKYTTTKSQIIFHFVSFLLIFFCFVWFSMPDLMLYWGPGCLKDTWLKSAALAKARILTWVMIQSRGISAFVGMKSMLPCGVPMNPH